MALKGPHTDLTLERAPIHAALTACKIGIAMRQLAATVERNLRNAIWMAPCHWEVHPSGRAGSTGVKPTPRPIVVGVELYMCLCPATGTPEVGASRRREAARPVHQVLPAPVQ